MKSEEGKMNSDVLIKRLKKSMRPGSEGENIYEDEKEQKFDSLPLIKPPVNYK